MFLRKKRHFLNVSSGEEQREQAEGPDQRRETMDEACIVRHEAIRLVVIAVSFLALLLSFLIFLLVHTIVPLFISIALISISYSCLDRHFCASEHSPPWLVSRK